MKEVKQELVAEHIQFGEVKQGIMIETPAAALCSDIFAKEVDFFSLGTNDLTQHTLAMDRQNMQLKEVFNGKNPAVIKLIKYSIESAHLAGIPIEICGELGGDLSFIRELIDMEMDSISVVPSKILEIRDAIRKLDLSK
jgi:phosphotransferase system enzyme I (PtsI)